MRTQEVSVLKAHDLKCVKGSTELFSNIHFEVQSGEALVVEGSNGSGKTSLLRILCGFNYPAEGEISWNGASIDDHEELSATNLIYRSRIRSKAGSNGIGKSCICATSGRFG